NPDTAFETKDVKIRTRVGLDMVRREIARISNLGLVKRKSFFKETEEKTKKGVRKYKRRRAGWILNKQFVFIEPLRNILLNSDSFQKETIVDRFKNIGRLKLLIVSGIFVDEMERTDTRGRVDILLVGDHFKQRIIHASLRSFESEIGRELQYAVMKTDDFLYRRGIYDKFIRDVLDYPHEILVNKLGI
ncbi:MAG: hypothetical protein Q8R36_03960, partial [bacterium]|nr:hypothetical protein [bacterium]